MLYVLNLFLIIFYYFVIYNSSLKKKKKKLLFAWIISLHAILFRALASPYDFVDTENYATAFLHIANLNLKQLFLDQDYIGWGYGYVMINWLISKISTDVHFFFVSISILSVGIVMYFYSRTSHSLILTALLYFIYPMMYLMGFGVIRQHLSVAFVFLALYFIDDLKKSIPFAVLAILTHYAALIFIPYYFWRSLDTKKMYSLKVIILMVLGFVLLRMIMGSTISTLDEVGISRYNSFGEENDHLNIMPFIIFASLVTMLLWARVFSKCQGRDSEILNFTIYGLLVSIFSLGLSGGGRLTIYVLYIVPVAATLLLKYAHNIRDLSKVYVALLTLLFFRQNMVMMSNFVISFDYKFFWE